MAELLGSQGFVEMKHFWKQPTLYVQNVTAVQDEIEKLDKHNLPTLDKIHQIKLPAKQSQLYYLRSPKGRTSGCALMQLVL